jgi:ABC-type amino acid transport system permease subunit
VTIAPAKRSRRTRLRISPQSREFSGLLWQILVVGITFAAVARLWSNAIHNLSARRISTGFGFLNREAGMPIVDTWLAYTSPVLIIGIFDLLTTAKTAIIDPVWQQFSVEVYLFVAAIYFMFCFAMSRYSRRLEAPPTAAK